MDQGFPLSEVLDNVSKDITSRVTIAAFNLTSDPCLPTPIETSEDVLWPIYSLLLASTISCLLDGYFYRLRSRICNFFFPGRADERAEFLHRSIKSGRLTRKNEIRK